SCAKQWDRHVLRKDCQFRVTLALICIEKLKTRLDGCCDGFVSVAGAPGRIESQHALSGQFPLDGVHRFGHRCLLSDHTLAQSAVCHPEQHRPISELMGECSEACIVSCRET